MIDYEELVGAMTAGFEDVISSVAYSVVLDDENRLEWRGMIDGKPATEKAEPLASR